MYIVIGSRLIGGAAAAAELNPRPRLKTSQNDDFWWFLLSVLDGKHSLRFGPLMRKHRNTSFLLSVLAGKHSFKIVFFNGVLKNASKNRLFAEAKYLKINWYLLLFW